MIGDTNGLYRHYIVKFAATPSLQTSIGLALTSLTFDISAAES